MLTSFSELSLAPELERGIKAIGFTEPRPIQAQAIPAALKGRDVLGLAQTGTGKTAAFALPMLDRILKNRAEGPRALVVAPTRELASQITEEIRALARYTRIRVATLFGGVSAHKQKIELNARPEIIVACPGRLLDLFGQRLVRLDKIETLVLDEADHMFDMGFLPDIKRILAALPENRQNLLFSATMPTEIRRLANRILNNPEVVDVNSGEPIETIEHAIFSVEGDDKVEMLERVLKDREFVSAIVFTRTKHRAKKLARRLDGGGYKAIALQGNMSQNQRVKAMSGFRSGEFNVLVATDIAARGIDVEQVSHVVNFDMPMTPEAYTHRIGRTGRAERRGRAYTFVTPDDHDMVRAVERRMDAEIPHLSVDAQGHTTIEPRMKFTSSSGSNKSRRPANGAKRGGPRRPNGPSPNGRRTRRGAGSASPGGGNRRRSSSRSSQAR